MFKKNDHIVCLKKPNGILDYVRPNYIFQQIENSNVFYVQKDLIGGITSCSDLKFIDKDNTWRYATVGEVFEYKRLGIPYDVTTLKSKSYDYEVVHCTTQEEWDFVRSKTTKTYSKDWEEAKQIHPEEIALKIDGKGWDRIKYFNSLYSKIYSFQEWCSKFGYIMKKEKPITTELTSLPKKWCIRFKDPDQFEVIKPYFASKNKNHTYTGENRGYNSDYGYSSHIQDHIDRGYVEITLDQFKKWVMNKNSIPAYKHLPFPDGPYFTARVVKDLKRSEIGTKGDLPVIILKGSITWFSSRDYDRSKELIVNKSTNSVHPESNRFSANIPANYFELIEEFNVVEKPIENFEVDQWYEFTNPKRYAKFTKLSKDKKYWHWSERITPDSSEIHKFYDGNWSTKDCIKKANLSEIQQYLPDEHPDKEESLVGRYLKALVDHPQAIGPMKKGDYIKITSVAGGYGKTEKFGGHTWSFNTIAFGTTWELMPVGFNPDSETTTSSSSTLHKSMEEIQKICKAKYPIGSVIRSTAGINDTLLNDRYLYSIHGNEIWCHSGAGLLYSREGTREQWAEIIKLPEVTNISKFDLVPGITYVGYWDKYEIIFQPLKGSLEDCYYISTSDTFKRGPCCTAEGYGIKFRLATPEEEQKLLHFINQQKQEKYEKQLDTPTTRSAERNNYEVTEPIISKQKKQKNKLIVAKLEEAIL